MDVIEQAQAIRKAMDVAGGMLTDEQAAEVPALYKAWETGVDFVTGDKRQYKGVLYKCLQGHRSQETWNPEDAVSLWAKVLVSDDGEILPWEQPDSTNPYMKGDEVTHKGENWVSDIDNNVWEPGVYGWTKK